MIAAFKERNIHEPLMSASETLVSALRGLQIARIRMAHALEFDLHVGPFAGDVWRSVFGLALDTVSESLRLEVMAPDSGVKHWSLRPPSVLQDRLLAGQPVHSEIVLFGPLCNRLAEVFTAIRLAGDLGFGKLRIKAKLLGMDLLLADGTCTSVAGLQARSPVTAWDVYQQSSAGMPINAGGPDGLHIRFVTPLNIKHQNQTLRQAPPLRLLVTRIIERAEKLCDPKGAGRILEAQEWRELVEVATQCCIIASQLEWVERIRYSAAQQQSMPWGGLVGHITYSAPAARLAPWFALAEWLQLGSKVTSGQGVLCTEVI